METKASLSVFAATVMAIVAGIIIGVLLVPILTPAQPQKLGDASGYTPPITSATNATVTLAPSTSTLILAASGGRQAATICNATTTAGSYVFVSVGATAAANQGTLIAPGNCYSLRASNSLFTGALYGYPSVTTTTVSLTYTQ